MSNSTNTVQVEDSVSRFYADLLAKQPDPPRQVAPQAVLRLFLGQTSTIVMVCCAVIAFVFGIVINITGGMPGQPITVSDRCVGVGAFAFALLTTVILLSGFRSYLLAARRGRRGFAVTLEMSRTEPGDSRSLSALKYGTATGTRRVTLASEVFESRFTISRPWISLLHPGSQVEVLVHPKRQRVLITVRPLNGHDGPLRCTSLE